MDLKLLFTDEYPLTTIPGYINYCAVLTDGNMKKFSQLVDDIIFISPNLIVEYEMNSKEDRVCAVNDFYQCWDCGKKPKPEEISNTRLVFSWENENIEPTDEDMFSQSDVIIESLIKNLHRYCVLNNTSAILFPHFYQINELSHYHLLVKKNKGEFNKVQKCLNQFDDFVWV